MRKVAELEKKTEADLKKNVMKEKLEAQKRKMMAQKERLEAVRCIEKWWQFELIKK